MSVSNSLTLMDEGRITRSLKRIAFQIAETNKMDIPVVLVGINERGSLIARKLSEHLSAVYSNEVKSFPLFLAENANETLTFEKAELENKFLVLVDDVIFSGRTMFKALKFLSRQLKLEEIHTVVLVDRGHRKLPIEAQFTGLDLPTKLNEHVSLVVDGDDLVGVQLLPS